MSEIRKTIDDASRTLTVLDGTERILIRDSDGEAKITTKVLATLAISDYMVGELKEFDTYISISSDFPWFCLSLADQELDTTNYSSDFIDYQRAKKAHYDEFDTDITSFSGTWSSNVFTLIDNTANNAIIQGLASDYIFQGDFTNFRVLSDGTNDFEITGINTTALTITVDNTDNTPSGTSIEIYLNRVYGSTSACRHYSQAGLVNYQAGDGKIAGLRHLDQMQQITGEFSTNLHATSAISLIATPTGAISLDGAKSSASPSAISGATTLTDGVSFDSSDSPDSRTSYTTDGETMARNIPLYKYIYVKSYTA